MQTLLELPVLDQSAFPRLAVNTEGEMKLMVVTHGKLKLEEEEAFGALISEWVARGAWSAISVKVFEERVVNRILISPAWKIIKSLDALEEQMYIERVIFQGDVYIVPTILAGRLKNESELFWRY